MASTSVSVSTADKSKPYIPTSGLRSDGWSNESEATATCFCGAIQLIFPLKAPGLVPGGVHICNCTDCHKIHSSMFGSNFTVLDSHLKHVCGESDLKQFTEKTTTTTGNAMTNFFCTTCGSLMYRRGSGFPGMSILRIGTVDDFNLMETVLKPDVEQFVEDRVNWLPGTGAAGVKQVVGFNYK
ncbi:Mss4-like protein [Lophiotrema nucula]|uniref:Mss4-like protein n=1 Tax=Lophiotrema nucula TaxID=690887 RepID=A0A6A5YFC3_9PLEO|nr:Mss4-like protein [Lophiotrema nucula]